MSAQPDKGPIGFAEKLLALLQEGNFSATYKYAVLLGLMDLCLEQASTSGAAPTVVTTRQLAEKVLELYWPHTVPFPADRAPVLRQNTVGQAEILSAIGKFRTTATPASGASLSQARLRSPESFEKLARLVEWKLIEMPLPRLQVMGNQEHRFIYEIAWDKNIRRADVLNRDSFDNRIQLVASAGEHLVALAGLLRPLIQRQWAAMVAQINSEVVEDARLEDFLFGATRISLKPIRSSLRELQNDRCFYCAEPLRSLADVDHFLPWARHPDNGIHNLVLADSRCNGDKSHFLAAAPHVEQWFNRMTRHSTELATIAQDCLWESHAGRTASVARAVYLRLPDHAMLWSRRREFVPVDRAMLTQVLSLAAAFDVA